MYRIHEIKLNLDEDKMCIPSKIEKKFLKEGIPFKVREWRIVKESIDARDKCDIKKVYSVDFKVDKEIELPLDVAKSVVYELPLSGNESLERPPVICGFGPCGIFAALILAEAGYKPIVIERGAEMVNRVRDVEKFWASGELNEESNVQFGEGGAGTFSDGKLTTGIKDKRIRKVLEEFFEAGADEDILYKQKPHIGTDKLRNIVVELREKIKSLGGEVRFNSKLTDIILEDGKIKEIIVNGDERIPCQAIILALGHSARDTFRMLNERGIEIVQKPFSIGVRVEHMQKLINKAQYGASAEKYDLPPAEYKLSYKCKNGRGVYTFCMCPGGEVILSSSQKEGLVTNGMSYHARDGEFANSALLVDVRTEDFNSQHPLAGIDFQEKYEHLAYENSNRRYVLPRTTWGEFKNKTDEAKPVINSLPEFAVDSILEAMPMLGRKLKGFDSDEAIFKAVETRSSSPIRILRNDEFQCNVMGIYPAGEGAGYAGGIMSAAVDGIKIAESIILKYKK